MAEARDASLRVEVAARGVDATAGECAGDVLGPLPGDREGDGGRAWRSGRWSVEADAADGRETAPETIEEETSSLFEEREGLLECHPTREPRSLSERCEEVDGRRCSDDALVVLRPRLEMLGRVRVRRLDTRRIERCEPVEPSPKHADV